MSREYRLYRGLVEGVIQLQPGVQVHVFVQIKRRSREDVRLFLHVKVSNQNVSVGEVLQHPYVVDSTYRIMMPVTGKFDDSWIGNPLNSDQINSLIHGMEFLLQPYPEELGKKELLVRVKFSRGLNSANVHLWANAGKNTHPALEGLKELFVIPGYKPRNPDSETQELVAISASA